MTENENNTSPSERTETGDSRGVKKVESLEEKYDKIVAVENLKEAFERKADIRLICHGLTGIGNEVSMIFRRQLLDSGASINDVAESLIGVEHEESMILRDDLLEEGADVDNIGIGLTATKNQPSMEFREKLTKRGISVNTLAASLFGIDNPAAREQREWLLQEGDKLSIIGNEGGRTPKKQSIARNILWNLGGIDSEESMRLREELFTLSGEDFYTLLVSLRWVGNEESMNLREEFMDLRPHWGSSVCSSLWGVGNLKAMELRRRLLEQSDNKNKWDRDYFDRHFAESFLGVDNPESMSFRKQRLQDIRDDKRIANTMLGLMHSLKGIPNPESMRLREELCYLMELKEELFSIGRQRLGSYNFALDNFAKSLGGVYNKEANTLRAKYLKCPHLTAISYAPDPHLILFPPNSYLD